MRPMNLSRRMALVLAVVVLGTTACGDDSTTDADAPVTTVAASGGAPPVIELPAGALGGGGAVAAESASADAARTSMIAWMEYVFEGAPPATPATGAAWRFPADPTLPSAALTALAQALGLEGEPAPVPADQGGGWVIGSADYTGPSLRVSESALLDWYYSPGPLETDPVAMPACEAVEPAVAPDGDASGATSAPSPGCDTVVPEPPAGVPSADEARARLVELLNAAGIDPAAYELEASADDWGAYASGYLVLDGVRSQVAVSVGFGAEGVLTYASGVLATPERVGDYPLLDAAGALARLNEQSGQWMDTGVAVPMDDAATSEVAPDEAVSSDGTSSSDGTAVAEPADAAAPVSAVAPVDPAVDVIPAVPCPEPATVDPAASGAALPSTVDCGVPVPSGPITVVITGVRPELTMVWDATDEIWLLPAFTFLAGDGTGYSVVAVTDEYLVVPEVPMAEPGVGGDTPTEPADGGGQAGELPAPLDQAVVDTLVGLSAEEAERTAAANGWAYRVAELDGEPQALTMDYSPQRVNVSIAGGAVIAVTVG